MNNKIGLVMEGGSMRGMFTAGVADVMMENGITFPGAIGVSAGAAFGCNYKSRQIGRAIRYNKRFCADPRYAGFRSLITTGDLYNAEFCYSVVPKTLDIFDTEAFRNNPMEFYVTCTDVETGEAVYHKCENGDDEDIKWIRASASLPLAAKIVEIDGYKLLDGGIADSIPLRHFKTLGYNKNIVILTQPLGYKKEKNALMPIMRLALHKYPKMIEAVRTRHLRYNAATEYVAAEEKIGNALVIRPPEPLGISGRVKDPNELERVYRIGRKTAEKMLDEIKSFMGEQ